eukprot:1158102-Pelagomonas_calceolata.AAC.6
MAFSLGAYSGASMSFAFCASKSGSLAFSLGAYSGASMFFAFCAFKCAPLAFAFVHTAVPQCFLPSVLPSVPQSPLPSVYPTVPQQPLPFVHPNVPHCLCPRACSGASMSSASSASKRASK